MRKLLISAALLSLIAASPALAQRGDDNRGGGGSGGASAAHAPAPAPAAPAPAAPASAAPAAPAAPAFSRGHSVTPSGPSGIRDRRGVNRPTAPANNAPAAHAAAPQAAPGQNRGFTSGNRGSASNRGGAGNRPDYSSYHRNFTAPQHFRAPQPYHRPSGWYAQRWTYGEILPPLFWGRDYWIDDYSDFDLGFPPPGTVWVRDGDDALLIDQYTGEIIQVEYGVFY